MNDVLEEILEDLDPEQVPPQFIINARYIDGHGREKIVSGEELADVLKNERSGITEMRVTLDVRKIRKAVLDEISVTFARINGILSSTVEGFDPDFGEDFDDDGDEEID